MTRYKQPEKDVVVSIKMSKEMRDQVKKAARLDHRSQTAFCLAAVEQRVKQFLSEEPSSKDFVPIGLRH